MICAICPAVLPAGSRRQTCSDRCRKRLERRRKRQRLREAYVARHPEIAAQQATYRAWLGRER